MPNQTCKQSFIEACINVGIGFGVSFIANAIILPIYGMPFVWKNMWEISIIFTALSVVRSYFVRRLFVFLHKKGIQYG